MNFLAPRSGQPLLGGVELGGTKCVCLVGTGPADVRARVQFPTGNDPEATLDAIARCLEQWRREHGPIAALGVASFGPLELSPGAERYGFLRSTPKPGWSHVDLLGILGRALKVPVGLDTDVNGAARAEARWGEARGLSDFAYVTVGTGIGVGLMAGGRPVQGFTHCELGHIRVERAAGDEWRGSCPFHGDCLEGLASGPAIEQRSGRSASALSADDPVWALVAHALGQLLHTLVLTNGPWRILMGGGVMLGQPHLFDRLRRELPRSLNRYVLVPQAATSSQSYLAAPGLGADAGPLGALAVAADALRVACVPRNGTLL